MGRISEATPARSLPRPTTDFRMRAVPGTADQKLSLGEEQPSAQAIALSQALQVLQSARIQHSRAAKAPEAYLAVQVWPDLNIPPDYGEDYPQSFGNELPAVQTALGIVPYQRFKGDPIPMAQQPLLNRFDSDYDESDQDIRGGVFSRVKGEKMASVPVLLPSDADFRWSTNYRYYRIPVPVNYNALWHATNYLRTLKAVKIHMSGYQFGALKSTLMF